MFAFFLLQGMAWVLYLQPAPSRRGLEGSGDVELCCMMPMKHLHLHQGGNEAWARDSKTSLMPDDLRCSPMVTVYPECTRNVTSLSARACSRSRRNSKFTVIGRC
jgi:hypothetical protein